MRDFIADALTETGVALLFLLAAGVAFLEDMIDGMIHREPTRLEKPKRRSK